MYKSFPTLYNPVFSGSLVINGSGWMEIGFSSAFNWGGAIILRYYVNLMMVLGIMVIHIFIILQQQIILVYKYSGGSAYSNKNRPNIRFATVDSAPNPANYVYPANNGYAFTVGDSLTWVVAGRFSSKI